MKHESNIEWRDETTARVRVSAGYDPLTGKRLRPSKTVHGTKRDVSLVKSQMLAGMGRLTDSTMSVSEFVDGIFVPFQESRVLAKKIRRRTASNYASLAARYITPFIGKVRLCDLSADLLERWMLNVAISTGVSERTQLHAFRVMDMVCRRAMRASLISANPMALMEKPHPEMKCPDTLTVDEVAAYIESFRGTPLFAAVVVSLAAGTRRSETVGLDWNTHVRFSQSDRGTEAFVTIDHGVHQEDGVVWDESPKSRQSRRTVMLPTWATRELWTVRGIGPILAQHGERMKPALFTYHYRRHFVTHTDMRYVPLKNLRHTHATLALDATKDLKAVSQRMGHGDTTITDRYYIGARKEADAAVASALDDMLGPRGATGPQGATSVAT